MKIKDPIYGGFFFSTKSAEDSKRRGGCPPSEIMMAYLNGDEFSLYSKVKISEVSEKIAEHTAECKNCTDYIGIIREHAPVNKRH
ncbi:MAG: hypothetical protein AAB581_03385 [Patescibacteria group bacterium]